MADAAGPSQTGPIAAPPVREKRPPGHAPTEAEFFGDETAALIGGRYGIPNGMLAAAAGAPPGSPDDVGSLLGRLDGRRARGLALQLQRTMGNGGLHAMLAGTRPVGVVGRGQANGNGNGHRPTPPVVQRQPPSTTVPPPPPGSSADRPISPEEQEKLERDDREFKALSGSRGSAEIWLENPRLVLAGQKEKRVESFTIQSLIARSTEADQRRSWDQEGPALAMVVSMSAGQGGAVIKGATGYFAAVGSGSASLSRDKVFQVRPTNGITRIVGIDGFAYAPGDIYEPDVGRGEQKLDTQAKDMAGTASAADLARIAGIPRPEDANAPPADRTRPVEIPEAQVRQFLRQYMVARAVEILDANAEHARKEILEFKGTAKANEPATTAIPPAAQKKIDRARDMGKKFSKLLDMERDLEELEAKVGRGQTTGGGSRMLVTVDGKRLMVETWRKRIAASRQILASGKAQILSENPLIAQLVDPRIGREEWAMQARALTKATNPILGGTIVKLWDRATGTDNPFSRSELAKPSSPESDQKVREDYVKKLDQVLIAIGKVKAKVLAGDERYLFSLPGLGQRVRAELKAIGGANSKLGPALEKIIGDLGMSGADIAATVVEVAGIVLQLAGFFFPPLLFIGAVMSFGASAYNMDKALDKLQVSQAAVTPEEAMVDPAEAQAAMIDHTIDLAMQAITVGMEVGSALEALEAGRTKDLEKLAAKGEPKPKEIAEPKPGEPPKSTEPVPEPAGKGGPAGTAGAVDPRLTTKTGLAGADALRKHTEAMHELAAQWGSKSPVERAFLLQGRAQGAAAEAGIPHKIIVTPDKSLKGMRMKFDPTTMAVKVPYEVLENATVDMASVGELVYHETRHAEQTWQMARMRATMGESAEAIARDMGIPQELADQAFAKKLPPGSEEYRAAFRWYDSMYGAGRARRTELLKPGGLLETSENKLIAAKQAFNDGQKAGKSTEELNNLHQEWSRAWHEWEGFDKEYRMLPEEQDAYLVGGRARRQLDITNPDTAPVTSPTPSVPPPDTTPSPPPAHS